MKKWSDETMNEPIIEERFEYKGFPCVVMFLANGFRCGCVGLPKGHKYYGKAYNLIPISCHGGLNYSEYRLYGQEDKETYWIGFMCNCSGDGIDVVKIKKYYGSAVKNQASKYWNLNGTVRNFDYVKKECITIVEQLERINNGLE